MAKRGCCGKLTVYASNSEVWKSENDSRYVPIPYRIYVYSHNQEHLWKPDSETKSSLKNLMLNPDS